MILTVTPNPCVDKTVFVDDLKPGTKILSRKCGCVPGGKGSNVSRAVKALGRNTKAMTIVGGHTGAHVVDMIRHQDGVEVVPVWVASPTRTITTVLEEPIHRQTALFEPGPRVTDEEAANAIKTFAEIVGQAKVVTFNGTVPDPNIETLYMEFIPIARQQGVTTILDSHGPEFKLGVEAMPYMIKPNVVEAAELVGHPLETDLAKWKAIDFFHNKGVELVVMSLGKEGALVSRGEERFQVVPPAIKEVNPVGSGDALVAGFAIGLMEGMALEEMAVLACAAGTANAMSWDIGHFSIADVENIITHVQRRRIAVTT
ncbi:MAG TPA: 1-phosphofructokinase family hexose kinase [Candidatus Hydrogenedentes bacterium]|nr:1-phosphofructokinase family hexose kinase [Candidatus Hydrogenedentota bacterium]